MFSSPEKIENKIKDIVKDSVKTSALWIGHSSILVQIYDKVILIDPFLSERLGGLFLRKKEAGIDINNLSRLDMVLLSHSHMDHLNFNALDEVSERFPKSILVFPSGTEQYLPDFGLEMRRISTTKSQSKNYIGNAVLVNGIKITPVFARHTGGRYAIDTYLWKVEGVTGFILEYKDVCIYYAGDTGYDDRAFKKIGDRFKINLALIPVGPCKNCDSAGFRFHTSSIEALMLMEDIRAEYMIPIHYGSIKYFTDPNYPLMEMKRILNNDDSGFAYLRQKIKILKEGEQIIWRVKEY